MIQDKCPLCHSGYDLQQFHRSLAQQRFVCKQFMEELLDSQAQTKNIITAFRSRSHQWLDVRLNMIQSQLLKAYNISSQTKIKDLHQMLALNSDILQNLEIFINQISHPIQKFQIEPARFQAFVQKLKVDAGAIEERLRLIEHQGVPFIQNTTELQQGLLQLLADQTWHRHHP